MTIQELETLVQSKKVHQIRCGDHRFIDITIVATEGRFFVRQYKFGKRSWYDAFLVNPEGAMKIGNLEVEIKGVVPHDLDEVNPKVNKAYRKLLGLLYPAMRLTYNTKKHEASTLELIPIFD
ncbi:DUF2255 family protein [Tenacibaculum aiptasiae]|uniref:DUF2255 family protein n=1 Tax=Tenacibaculum aiptasiae TaxID=426481 RepID=A0A7J5AR40_9FLAO|nr:DUF2255 family protein [Tenacibaculum aiptasiae]KAB1159423.1 DUF2255 family protein [Tenacibaculum aiptasiae]